MFKAVQSLYQSVSSCVRISGLTTDWFDVTVGLCQGCPLSPLLFNCFINDLAQKIKAVGKGVSIDNGEQICILLYADDVVLLAENEADLQSMLNVLSGWCEENCMTVNNTKSKIVHYRSSAVPCTKYVFSCSSSSPEIVDRYVYLGLVIHEHLDWNVTAKVVAQSANRALGLLIAKSKFLGGMPYSVFSKLFDSVVWSVIAYGAAVWGSRKFSCIEAVQHKAQRYYLGTGKYTPSAAVAGDMGWIPAFIKQYKCVCKQWARYTNMPNDRIIKRIYNYCKNKSSARCQNWYFRVSKHFTTLNCHKFVQARHRFSSQYMFRVLSEKMMNKFTEEWRVAINNSNSRSGTEGNKLPTYKLFKRIFGMEQYCKIIMSPLHHSALAKFHCGVAPLRLETGRYEGLSVSDRICPFCRVHVEDETHVLLNCGKYYPIRKNSF